MTEFGTILQGLRANAGMTQQELARKVGMSVAGLARLEQGAGDPSWRTVLKLAHVLGVSLAVFDDLVSTSQKKPKK
ncbi:xre family transcriptional regulator : : HTH_31 [Gemmata massiliana]|uniref:Xre family transcriptional regulator:: HTH_31 n=1 Tax=Gemmata massiliana TaxID=1210884 RepID=A0A6P2CPJ9_9BACT|nr:helix-turn-helix transcriptional regulator [Gemmata massiliana]VTR90833.1 xre family transcriptional regulator : : HTH_31 [Gemmata massiliana]